MRSPAYRQHYPGNALSASAWCKKCEANTQHRIFNHRLSHVCIPCQEKTEAARLQPTEPSVEKQQGFDFRALEVSR
jgi:hypothetical protein